ncbi:hypothetical protein LWI28_029010 [Acer negundo]|uniref:Uncharacterized protein n=1 Tax=Acer negundo TaxID=4023 RepID=A0AAD5NEX4_ACENE|nr:hypothetical protein LWI28_029010 [Acer negundo]
MASPRMLGLVEVPKSLEANLVSSPHTTLICGKRTVSSRSGGHGMGNVLPFIPTMDENTIQGPVMISSPLPMIWRSIGFVSNLYLVRFQIWVEPKSGSKPRPFGDSGDNNDDGDCC